METITEVIQSPSSKKTKDKPTIIKWKGVPMLRSQSINACIHEIYESSRSMGFLKINLIGASGSGKTQLGSVIAHQLHKLDPTFEVHKFEDSDLIDFRKTIENLSKANQILIFDDLSGLVAKFGKSALDKLKAEITTIRHIDDQEDRKIIMILNFHAQKTLDKFIRISNFTFYTDCQDEEIGYLEELLGKSKKQTILKFKNLRSQSRIFHKFSFPLGRKDKFTYKDSDPFRLVLYNNGISTRFVVTPQLKWVLGDDLCQVCNPTSKSEETKGNLDDFVNDFSKKFGKGIAKRAIELKLLRRGINTQPKRVQQAEIYIEQFFLKKKMNLQELAERYGLEENKTFLRGDKKPFFFNMGESKE